MQPSPVKQLVRRAGLPLLQPDQLRDPQFIRSLQNWQAEVFVVVAFRILPPEIFKIPPLGTINLHAALLPKYRGAAPIQWALMNGERETGVTTFFIDEHVDSGEIILQRKTPIDEFETAGELHDRLAVMGAELLIETLAQLAAGTVVRQRQMGQITLAPKLTKEMAAIDWNKSAREIFNFVRAMNPHPGAFTTLYDRNLKIFRAHVLNDFSTGHGPGVVVRSNPRTGELVVQAGIGHLAIDELQLEGKRRMLTADFLRGNEVRTHEQFG
jgi:methionyl-tRNA formyltransferase